MIFFLAPFLSIALGIEHARLRARTPHMTPVLSPTATATASERITFLFDTKLAYVTHACGCCSNRLTSSCGACIPAFVLTLALHDSRGSQAPLPIPWNGHSGGNCTSSMVDRFLSSTAMFYLAPKATAVTCSNSTAVVPANAWSESVRLDLWTYGPGLPGPGPMDLWMTHSVRLDPGSYAGLGCFSFGT